jgi:hypothetical protein
MLFLCKNILSYNLCLALASQLDDAPVVEDVAYD